MERALSAARTFGFPMNARRDRVSRPNQSIAN